MQSYYLKLFNIYKFAHNRKTHISYTNFNVIPNSNHRSNDKTVIGYLD